MSDPPLFILFQTIYIYRTVYCSILQNKHLAYKESIENSRLNYVSFKMVQSEDVYTLLRSFVFIIKSW